jgi:hypothetical protein
MKIFLTALFALVILASCNKDNDSTSGNQFPGGAYSGTFSRTGMDTAIVLINFSENRFDGSSNMNKYPAICHGSYVLNESTVQFADSCSWTADFDWTLILNGNYNIEHRDDGYIRIWRTNGTVTDEYIIRKLVR